MIVFNIAAALFVRSMHWFNHWPSSTEDEILILHSFYIKTREACLIKPGLEGVNTQCTLIMKVCNCLKLKYIYFLLSTVACPICTPLHLRAKDLIQARSTFIKFALCKFVDLITEELWEQSVQQSIYCWQRPVTTCFKGKHKKAFVDLQGIACSEKKP